VFDAVIHLATLGPVRRAGVRRDLHQRDGSFKELRLMERWVALSTAAAAGAALDHRPR
jgi:hypothetical protein